MSRHDDGSIITRITPIFITKMNKLRKALALFTVTVSLFTLTADPLFSFDVPSREIEDDAYIRTSLVDSWFTEVPERVLAKRPEHYQLRGGGQVQVRVETSPRNREEFAIVLARGQNGNFSSWNQGSWSLIRRRDNGLRGSRIQVFLRSDFNTYIQFRPFSDERSFMDVVIYNAHVIRSLPLPIPFERLYVTPLEVVLASVEGLFPRHYFDPEPGRYRDSMAFISSVRARLPELSFVDDGAVDENGEFVFINTLMPQDLSAQGRGGVNCSGFAKWVVDGILRPITGERLPIAPLKEPFGDRGFSYIEAWEELRDPFFGLDWNRNLASRAWAVLRSASHSSLEEIEVRGVPFSRLTMRQASDGSNITHPAFTENSGFASEALLPLLYTLAVDEPGRIYLAAVNNELGLPVTQVNPRGIPRMRQYYHVAVLVPFFNERGTFQIVVFESAAETSFMRFVSRYPGESVNLVRIPVENRFDP